MKQLIRKNYRLLQISPWIAILSTALLTLIIVIFAANNLQREKNHMVQTLLRKSQDIIQFIGVGTRTSLMMGNFGEKQLNQLLCLPWIWRNCSQRQPFNSMMLKSL